MGEKPLSMVLDEGCKVDRVIDQYGLDATDPRYESIDTGLLARWTGEDSHAAMGYRTLTEWFNKRLLRRAYDDHGRDALGGRVEHDYDVFTGGEEGESDLLREELEESLESDGIDAARIREDMVSWGTIRSHLLDCLNGEKQSGSDESEWERESVEMAKSFAKEKAESAVSSLGTKGKLDGVDASSVSVGIRIQCDVCPTRVPFEVALERGYVCEQHGSDRTR